MTENLICRDDLERKNRFNTTKKSWPEHCVFEIGGRLVGLS